MRAPWIIGIVGVLAGGAVIALGSGVTAVLVGAGIITVSLTAAATVRKPHKWAQYVFVLLAVMLGLGALWWADAELFG